MSFIRYQKSIWTNVEKMFMEIGHLKWHFKSTKTVDWFFVTPIIRKKANKMILCIKVWDFVIFSAKEMSHDENADVTF